MTRFTGTSAAVAIVVTVAGLSAGGHTGTGSPVEQQPASRVSDFPRGDVRNFIDKMLIAGLAEVQLGDLAVTRASNPDVKAFAEMMVKDHTAANVELQAIASQLQVTPPTDLDNKHRDLLDQLTNVRPSEFDREYAKAMIEDHQDVANQLRIRTGDPVGTPRPSGTDSPRPTAGAPAGTAGVADEDPLTRWARKTLPTIEQHLERAQQLQQNIK